MTPDAFKSRLSELGYSLVGFGREVDVGERTVRRWATGETPIPKAIQMLLEGKKLGRKTR